MNRKLARALILISLILSTQLAEVFLLQLASGLILNSSGTYEDFLICDSLGTTYNEWTTAGASPYLNTNDGNVSEIYSPTLGTRQGFFGFSPLILPGNAKPISKVYLYLTTMKNWLGGNVNMNVTVRISPSGTLHKYTVVLTSNSWINKTVDITSLFAGGSASLLNTTEICFVQVSASNMVYCTYAFLWVVFGKLTRRIVNYETGDSSQVDGTIYNYWGTYTRATVTTTAQYVHSGTYGIDFYWALEGSGPTGDPIGTMQQCEVDLTNSTFLQLTAYFKNTGGSAYNVGERFSPFVLTNGSWGTNPTWPSGIDNTRAVFAFLMASGNTTINTFMPQIWTFGGAGWQNGTIVYNMLYSVWYKVNIQIDFSNNSTKMRLGNSLVFNGTVAPNWLNKWKGIKHVCFGLWTQPGRSGWWARDMGFDDISICSTYQTIEIAINSDHSESHGLEGCGNWVFCEWKYYYFSVDLRLDAGVQYLDTVLLSFNTSTREGLINNTFSFKNSTDIWSLAFSPTETTTAPTRIETGQVLTPAALNVSVVFHVWFGKDSLDVTDPLNCVGFYTRANDTLGFDTGWIEAPNFIRIYNRGGFATNQSIIGNAGMIAGGEVFGFWAYNSSYAFRDYVYRDLQHIKLLPEFVFYVALPTFWVSYGLDYCTYGGDWQEGIKVIIGADAVGAWAPLSGWTEKWINFTVSWWNRGAWIKTDSVYAMYHGDAVGPGGTSYTRLWIDLWFNKMNSSSTIAGRVNAYEYPMMDLANAWTKWLSNNWGVKEDVQKESMCAADLLDVDDTTVISSQTIKMVRVWSSLEVASDPTYDQHVFVANYEVTDLTFCNPPLTGLQTPAFDETKVPSMPNGGFLGLILSGFSWIWKLISDNIIWGGLSLWPAFVSFLDTVAAWLGYPKAFSYFMWWIGGSWAMLLNSLGWLYSILAPVFVLLAGFMGKLITLVVAAFQTVANIISKGFGIIDGTIGAGGNLYVGLQIWTWILLALIIYPLYLVILWDEDGLDAVESELRRDYFVLHTIGSLMYRVVTQIIHIIEALVESIPVAE